MTTETWTTRHAIVLRDDLAGWQEVNVAAFLTGGLVGTHRGMIGAPYRDGSGNQYLPLLQEPVFVYVADSIKLQTIVARARRRDVEVAIYPEAIFATNNDVDNRATVAAVLEDDVLVAGVTVYGDAHEVDRVIKGAHRHS
jgi:hypothetical protein